MQLCIWRVPLKGLCDVVASCKHIRMCLGLRLPAFVLSLTWSACLDLPSFPSIFFPKGVFEAFLCCASGTQQTICPTISPCRYATPFSANRIPSYDVASLCSLAVVDFYHGKKDWPEDLVFFGSPNISCVSTLGIVFASFLFHILEQVLTAPEECDLIETVHFLISMILLWKA